MFGVCGKALVLHVFWMVDNSKHMCILIIFLHDKSDVYRGLGMEIRMKCFLLLYCPFWIKINADGDQSQKDLARLMPQITHIHLVCTVLYMAWWAIRDYIIFQYGEVVSNILCMHNWLISEFVFAYFKYVIPSLLLEVFPFSKILINLCFKFCHLSSPMVVTCRADGWYVFMKIWHFSSLD